MRSRGGGELRAALATQLIRAMADAAKLSHKEMGEFGGTHVQPAAHRCRGEHDL